MKLISFFSVYGKERVGLSGFSYAVKTVVQWRVMTGGPDWSTIGPHLMECCAMQICLHHQSRFIVSTATVSPLGKHHVLSFSPLHLHVDVSCVEPLNEKDSWWYSFVVIFFLFIILCFDPGGSLLVKPNKWKLRVNKRREHCKVIVPQQTRWDWIHLGHPLIAG